MRAGLERSAGGLGAEWGRVRPGRTYGPKVDQQRDTSDPVSVSIGLDGDNPAGEVLGNIPLIGQGAKEKMPPVPAANGGKKATIGEVMEKVVSTLNQSHHRQTNRQADGLAQAILCGRGFTAGTPATGQKDSGRRVY